MDECGVCGFRRSRYRGLERTDLAGYLTATDYDLTRIANLAVSQPEGAPATRAASTGLGVSRPVASERGQAGTVIRLKHPDRPPSNLPRWARRCQSTLGVSLLRHKILFWRNLIAENELRLIVLETPLRPSVRLVFCAYGILNVAPDDFNGPRSECRR